jgi:enoyl-CoA hydratase
LQNFKNIKINTDQNLGILTLDRKDAKNSLDIETSKEIYEGLKNLEGEKHIRTIVIQGNEKLFSPGADIKELDSLEESSAKQKGLFNYFDKIKEISIPVIASVEGYALGGGMELALICDFIIASKKASFGQPEINLGLIPGIGGTQRLKHYIGKFNANFLCMSGEMITAAKAYELGIVSLIIESDNYQADAIQFMKKIAAKPKSSLIEIKKLINLSNSLTQDLAEERKSFYKLLSSDNKKIGIESFLKKQKPNWKD